MAPTPLDQEEVFYTDQWTRKIETEFLSQLVDEALMGDWDHQGGNSKAVRKAMREINYRFNREFDFRYCRIKLGRLRNRYRVFKWITSLSGVAYDEAIGKISCSPDAWEFICEKERLGACYMEKGEEYFDWLKCLFESIPVSNDFPEDVIHIPSDGEDHDFEIPTYPYEVKLAVDPHFWDDVAEEFNEPSADDDVQSSAMSSSAASVIAKLKRHAARNGPTASKQRASTSLGSSASFSPGKKL